MRLLRFTTKANMYNKEIFFRHMSVEEKQPFLDMAETLKRQHHIDHPDYKFKPKQRSSTASKPAGTTATTTTTTTTTKKNQSLTRLFHTLHSCSNISLSVFSFII